MKALIVLLAGMAVATPAAAQYDRDGRYVPSPNGVPQDPYARPIPMYPGTPGEAIGTPSLPRAAIQPSPEVNRLPPPTTSYPYSSRSLRYVAPKKRQNDADDAKRKDSKPKPE